MTETADFMMWDASSEREWASRVDQLIALHRAGRPAIPVTRAAPVGDVEFPDRPLSADDYLEVLADEGLEHSARMHRPDCLGHMTSPLPGFMPQLARLVTALNQNMMKTESSGALTLLERRVLAVLHRMVFNDSDAVYRALRDDPGRIAGVIATGGTLANIGAMWCARKRALPGAGAWWRQLRDQGYDDAVIIGSRLMHYSFDKAADLMGLAKGALLKVDVDGAGAMRIDLLDALLAQCRRERRKVLAIVGVAGGTDFGSVDPLGALAERARAEGAHFHVDAAWGGPFLLSGRHAPLLAGIGEADTVTLDAHKQLLTPLGCGVLLYRDGGVSRAVMASAPYAVRPGSWDSGRFTLEGSRPASALYLHAAMHLIGRTGYRRLIDASFERARSLAGRIAARPELELLLEPVSNLVVFRYLGAACREREAGPEREKEINRRNVLLHKRLREAEGALLSRTERVLPGETGPARVMLRAVMYNPLCEDALLDRLLDDVIRTGRRIDAELAATQEVCHV
ncbi:pyridoxal-dependent decarboxylase [Paludibacterium paludis]|uniref:Decarboxylase n=1 Tax=Paludibacterium paludis TaxID=1225769 RepID=A0A918P541_9NEIS|nr:pyridoxal-dependent decarboxylase [Paludibacterium paludis]GGY18499.1 decarboxylase [Paludibacterium paludis]